MLAAGDSIVHAEQLGCGKYLQLIYMPWQGPHGSSQAGGATQLVASAASSLFEGQASTRWMMACTGCVFVHAADHCCQGGLICTLAVVAAATFWLSCPLTSKCSVKICAHIPDSEIVSEFVSERPQACCAQHPRIHLGVAAARTQRSVRSSTRIGFAR